MLMYNDIGNGTPIVLIHGLGSKKEAWVPQYELANHYRLIFPDLRGHGETMIEEGLTIKNFALDIIHLLESLEIESAFIGGLSLGGIIAQEIYKQRPDMVKGLILSNTTAYIPSFLGNQVVTLSEKLFHRDHQELMDYIVTTALYDQSFKEEAMQAFQIRNTYLDAARASVGVNYLPILIGIQKPVLLIGSTHDNVTPSLNLYFMRNFMWGAQTVIFDNTGHLSNIEKKDLFNQSIKNFLEDVA